MGKDTGRDESRTGSALFPLRRERIATQCICCGGETLQASPAVLMPFVAHRAFGWAPVVIDESWGLATIKSGAAYSICKSLHCPDCGLLFLDIRFSDAELGNLYRNYRDEEYNSLRETYEPGYLLRTGDLNAGFDYIPKIERFLEPHLDGPPSILDWGGDTGKNTPFRSNHRSLDIYEISDKPTVDGARRVGKEEALSKTYDLIVCSNVLEHVPYPSDVLLDIREVMDEDSILYIEIPLEDVTRNNNADLHLKKKHWHEHINFFSEKAIRSLVENLGFEVLALGELEIMAAKKSGHVFQIACRLRRA